MVVRYGIGDLENLLVLEFTGRRSVLALLVLIIETSHGLSTNQSLYLSPLRDFFAKLRDNSFLLSVRVFRFRIDRSFSYI